MRARGLLFLVAGAVGAGSPASAPAATIAAQGLFEAGPVLDGETVVWGEVQRGEMVVRAAGPGGAGDRVRLPALRRPRTTRSFGGLSSVLAASTGWLGFVETTSTILRAEGDFVSLTSSSRLRAGPPGASPPVVAQPKRAEATAVAAEGPVLAHALSLRRRDGCGAGSKVVIRWPSRQRAFTVAGGEDYVRRLSLAGRFVAWSVERGGGSATRVVVVDWMTGREVFRVGRSSRVLSFSDHDLRADGSVALLVRPRGRRSQTDLAVASPSAPRPKLIRRNVSGTRVELAGDRAAVALLGPESGREESLALIPLSPGSRPVVVARFPPGRSLLFGRFDFDGQRIAWAEADADLAGDVAEGTPTRVQTLDVLP